MIDQSDAIGSWADPAPQHGYFCLTGCSCASCLLTVVAASTTHWWTAKGSCSRLEPGRWHDLHLEWDSAKSECRVQLDGRPVARLEQSRDTLGPCCLRLRSTADSTDSAGLVVEAVKVAVSERS